MRRMGDTNVQLRGTAETGGDAIDISHSIAKVGVAGSNPVVRSKKADIYLRVHF